MRVLNPKFDDWFAIKGWYLHPHQVEMLERSDEPSLLLIAQTGGGKNPAKVLPPPVVAIINSDGSSDLSSIST